MKTLLSSALILGLLSFSTLGLVGCAEESKVEDKQTVKTPEGTKEITKTETIKATGDEKAK